jgi:hypothetical protein
VIDGNVKELIRKCLNYEVEERPTAEEVIQEISQL